MQPVMGGAQFFRPFGDALFEFIAGGLEGSVNALALADVGEGHDCTNHSLLITNRVGRVLGRKATAIAPPQHFVVNPHPLPVLKGTENPAVLNRHERRVGVRMVNQVMHLATKYFIRRKAQHLGASTVDEDATPVAVNAVYPLTSGFEEQLELAPPGCVMRKLIEI